MHEVDEMTTAKLGTLERVDVRNAWSHEAHNFTPWLAENLSRLSGQLGVELEIEDTEVFVGSFRADIVARVLLTDELVLIENQLECANLQHLGQVLAYLAGLEAQIVIWVATGFRDVHLSAIRWLNEHTANPFSFFAVQVSVVQIGDSQLAPVFDVLERPNEWNRQVQRISQSGDLTVGRKAKRDFWHHFVANWPDVLSLPSGYAGFNPGRWIEEVDLKIRLWLGSESVGIDVLGRKSDTREDVKARMEPFRTSFEAAFEDLASSNEEAWWVTDLNVGSTYDRQNWEKMADWIADRIPKYEEILRGGPDVAA